MAAALTSPFTIRVYGLALSGSGKILLSDECYNGHRFTKFPGGGMEFGEGPVACLEREFQEEMNLQISVTNHFYTTHFFQASAFNPKVQVMSIYYRVQFTDVAAVPVSATSFDFADDVAFGQSFRWISLTDLKPDLVTFPIDKHVVSLLHKEERRVS